MHNSYGLVGTEMYLKVSFEETGSVDKLAILFEFYLFKV